MSETGISPLAAVMPTEDGPRRIDRREAIRIVSMLMGGVALVGGSALLTGCASDAEGGVIEFTPDEIALLDEIAETILPETSTPGAKAAGVGAFMALMVKDSYWPENQKVFRDGLAALAAEGFMQATPEERLARLEALDAEQKAEMDRRAAERDASVRAWVANLGSTGGEEAEPHAPGVSFGPPPYFRMMKELALLGYFTSEIGYTQAMRYIESPGRFDPCLPHAPGEKIWAAHA